MLDGILFARDGFFCTCLCLERASYYSAIYRNKESSEGTLEAETDEARSKDLKMQVRKTWKHNRWNEQGSNLRLDAAPVALPR